MKFKVTIYKATGDTESWVDSQPIYYELHRLLEKCEIDKLTIEAL